MQGAGGRVQKAISQRPGPEGLGQRDCARGLMPGGLGWTGYKRMYTVHRVQTDVSTFAQSDGQTNINCTLYDIVPLWAAAQKGYSSNVCSVNSRFIGF